MGVKSTVRLTREQAEIKYLNLKFKLDTYVGTLSDTELEDRIKEMNDRINGGEGFENYRIIG